MTEKLHSAAARWSKWRFSWRESASEKPALNKMIRRFGLIGPTDGSRRERRKCLASGVDSGSAHCADFQPEAPREIGMRVRLKAQNSPGGYANP